MGIKCFSISSGVRPGQVAKNPFLMALEKVDLDGEKPHPCRYAARSVFG